jgi:hypothetical protein
MGSRLADDASGLREQLDQVLWLGGSACSGKTTVARRLAARYGLAIYHTDDSFERLREQADPRRHPAFCRVGDLSLAALLAAPAAEQAVEMLAFHREHFALVLADLAAALATPAPGPRPGPAVGPPVAGLPRRLLVEGSCLLPAEVAAVAAAGGSRSALWLLATPAFRRRVHARRRAAAHAALGIDGERPEAAVERWLERDDALADWRRRELAARGLSWRDVDGRLPVERQVAAVAAHFGLAAGAGAADAARADSGADGAGSGPRGRRDEHA